MPSQLSQLFPVLQLCLQMAAVTAWRGERVIYFDTGQAFSARRVVEMAAALHTTQAQVKSKYFFSPSSSTFLSWTELFAHLLSR